MHKQAGRPVGRSVGRSVGRREPISRPQPTLQTQAEHGTAFRKLSAGESPSPARLQRHRPKHFRSDRENTFHQSCSSVVPDFFFFFCLFFSFRRFSPFLTPSYNLAIFVQNNLHSLYRKDFYFVDRFHDCALHGERCAACREAHTNFADESACLMADYV
jgi:hypothetical protein